MKKIESKIIEEYTKLYRIEAESYNMMGKMLNEQLVKSRVEKLNIKNVYLYGGTYLAAQFCRAVNDNTYVKAVVDKNGISQTKLDVPILTLEELQKVYSGEVVIVTLLKYYNEIKKDLMKFVDENKIMTLGYFLEGYF